MGTPQWLDRHFTVACTIYQRIPSGVDEYNNVTYTEVATPSRCFIQPASQEEIQDGRAVVGGFTAHFGADVVGVLDGFARIEVVGASYEVIGPPAVYPSLTQPGVHHVEVAVTRSSA